jgi:hypothetical protein
MDQLHATELLHLERFMFIALFARTFVLNLARITILWAKADLYHGWFTGTVTTVSIGGKRPR